MLLLKHWANRGSGRSKTVAKEITRRRCRQARVRMLHKLVLLFVAMPLIELTILLYLGSLIGVLYTILIVVVTGVVGAFLTKQQGLITISRIRSQIDRGILPADEFFQAALILGGGLLLLTPGLITDLAGFAMLIPKTRNFVARWLRSCIQSMIQRRELQYWQIR